MSQSQNNNIDANVENEVEKKVYEKLPFDIENIIISDSPSGQILLDKLVQFKNAKKYEQKEHAYYQVCQLDKTLYVFPKSFDGTIVNNHNNRKNVQLYNIVKKYIKQQKVKIHVIGIKINIISRIIDVFKVPYDELILEEDLFNARSANCKKMYRWLKCDGFKDKLPKSEVQSDISSYYL